MVVTVSAFKGGARKPTSAISGDAAVGERIREYRSDGSDGSIVVDTPAAPRPEELVALGARSDVALVPTTPDALAVEALVDTVRDLKQEGVVFRVVLTHVPPFPSREGAKARTSSSKARLPVLKAEIPRAAAFQHAAKKGVLVRDLGDGRSAALWAAYQAVVAELQEAGGVGR